MWRYFFARFLVLYGVVFTPISHGNHTDLAPITCCLQCWLALLMALTDELAVGSKDHFHIFVSQLLGNVLRICTCSQQCRRAGVPDLVRIAVLNTRALLKTG